MTDAAANVVGDLYESAPGWLTQPDAPLSTPLSAQLYGLKMLADSISQPRNKVPLETPQAPNGGQCNCVGYRVAVRISRADGVIQNIFINTTGAVLGLGRNPDPPNADAYSLGLFSQVCTNGVPSGTKWSGITGDKTATVSLIGITRPDGQPDNCGNGQPQYPYRPPDPSKTGGDVNINLSPKLGLVVPFAYIPVSIQPTFAPQLRVDLGGLNFKFDLGGVDIYLPDTQPSPPASPGFPPPKPIQPLPDGGGNKPIGGGGTVVCPEIPPFPEIPACPPCPEIPPFPEIPVEKPPEGSPIRRPTNSGGEYSSPGITFLEVVLTTTPDKWAAGDGGQAVRYAGWVAFRDATGGYYPREPIAFDRSLFRAPVGAVGYTYTITNRGAGYTQYYVKQEEE